MKGDTIGYVRGSTYVQNPDRQLEGIETDKIFTDKASGKDVKCPQLEALLSFVRAGDTVIVHSMDRLARNLDDLRRSRDRGRAGENGFHFPRKGPPPLSLEILF